jgi:RND family efflux transporter MFP subunit
MSVTDANDVKIDPEADAPGPPVRRARVWLGRVLRLTLAAAILTGSAGLAYYWLANRPKTERRAPEPQATLVEAIPVRPSSERVTIQSMGTVIPAQIIQLPARVSGQVVSVDPRWVPGGRFAANDQILQIEREDYELAVAQQEGNLVMKESDVRLELGQQSVARREYELLSEIASEEDEELLLRQPQLDAKQAAVDVARALLERNRLDLRRTDVTAPFNAVVQTRNVDLGSYVNNGSPLATLIGTDEYWVEVSVPVDELSWIDVPGAQARIYDQAAWGPDSFRIGTVQQLLTDLEPDGRMARLIVSVKDPLELHAKPGPAHPLLLQSYVQVALEGREAENVVKTPRTAVHDGKYVWVLQPDGALGRREVRILWSGHDYVFIAEGLEDGDLLITSDLATPVPGMALRTEDAAAAEDPS